MSSARRPPRSRGSTSWASRSPTEGEAFHLTREGGHSHRRIVHVADATGRAVQQALESARRKQPNITLIPDMVAIDLVTGRHADGIFNRRRQCTGSTPTTASEKVETLTGTGDGAGQRAGPAAPTSSRPRRAARPATGSRWRGAPAAGCRTWSSCSSTRPASTTWRSRIS